MTITLTNDQQNALDAFGAFIMDPIETVFVLSGYSGTGKSTLVKTLVEKLPGFLKMAKLVNPGTRSFTTVLTATTNKAAESFRRATGEDVQTIHSYLCLRVQNDFKTNTSTLVSRKNVYHTDQIIFIDEASYVDAGLLKWIFTRTGRCKIVFIGDPAQLTPVKATSTPVFEAKFTTAHLSQVVRQAEGNPIIELSTKFRETVNTGEFFSFKPDGKAVKYLPRDEFNKEIESEFTRQDWSYTDSKVLAWTNKCVINYNHAVNDCVSGTPILKSGDYAVCNKFVSRNGISIKTDELVYISAISTELEEMGVPGHYYEIDNGASFFSPKTQELRKEFLKRAKANEDYHQLELAETQWIDLRAAYACTINKSQGSTYDKVFIDLDDIRRCNSGNQIARMLYVGVSRARQQVILTGDIA